MSGDDFIADTRRSVYNSEDFSGDTCRKRMGVMPADLKLLTIALVSKTLSDTFSVETGTKSMVIEQRLFGQVLDFPYAFLIDETTDQPGNYHATGKYDMDELLSKPLNISSSTGVRSGFAKVCVALGKTAAMHFTDFQAADFSSGRPTYRDCLSTWFGWTEQLPQRLINVFERGDTIYAIQRGQEMNNHTIIHYANPSVARKKVKTLQSATDSYGRAIEGAITGATFHSDDSSYLLSGTFAYGSAQITYSNGLVIQEAHTDAGGVTTTTYEYTTATTTYANGTSVSFNLLAAKDTTGPTTRTHSLYSYSGDTMSKEEENTYQWTDNHWELSASRSTYYYPLGEGHWVTITYVNGKLTNSSVGRGAPSGKASPYEIQKNSYSSTLSKVLPGRYLGTTSFPIADDATLTAIREAIIWLNGKTQETVTLECYDNHVIDFTDLVIWNGQSYYLDKNDVTQSPRKIVQALQLVRWF